MTSEASIGNENRHFGVRGINSPIDLYNFSRRESVKHFDDASIISYFVEYMTCVGTSRRVDQRDTRIVSLKLMKIRHHLFNADITNAPPSLSSAVACTIS